MADNYYYPLNMYVQTWVAKVLQLSVKRSAVYSICTIVGEGIANIPLASESLFEEIALPGEKITIWVSQGVLRQYRYFKGGYPRGESFLAKAALLVVCTYVEAQRSIGISRNQAIINCYARYGIEEYELPVERIEKYIQRHT